MFINYAVAGDSHGLHLNFRVLSCDVMISKSQYGQSRQR